MNAQKEIRWKQRFSNFSKAYSQLSAAIERIENLDDLAKEGLIQRFEYTFELAWKTLKDYMESQGIQAQFPREVIKEAFHYELIDNGELWMEMLMQRNLLAHTYNEVNFRRSIDKIKNHYFQAVTKLVELLNNKL